MGRAPEVMLFNVMIAQLRGWSKGHSAVISVALQDAYTGSTEYPFRSPYRQSDRAKVKHDVQDNGTLRELACSLCRSFSHC